MTVRPEPVWRLETELGEGPAWFAGEGALRFVDIKAGRIHRFDPRTGLGETIEVGGQPSFVVPTENHGILVGSVHDVFALEDGTLGRSIARIRQPRGNRTNDATVDHFGRLWFGTMDDAERDASGRIWCLDRGMLRCVGGEAVVTNGPAVTSDGRFLYHVDTSRRAILRCDLDDVRSIHDGHAFIQFDEADGAPDGVVLDAQDCLWVAMWDGWCVRRYSPYGDLLERISLPCARVTKLAFGGDDLRTAFVTTARVGLDGSALADQPLAGSLFAFEAPVAGRELPKVRLGGEGVPAMTTEPETED